jgi:hypothetical protein
MAGTVLSGSDDVKIGLRCCECLSARLIGEEIMQTGSRNRRSGSFEKGSAVHRTSLGLCGGVKEG